MGINTGSHDAGEKLYDPRNLYALSNWDTSREIQWAVDGADETPIFPVDYTRVGGCQVALSRVIRTPLPPEAAVWWTLTVNAREVARNFPNGGTVQPLDDSSTEEGLPSTGIQIALKARSEEIIVDIGKGVEFSFLAGNIDMDLLVPSTIVKPNINRRPSLYASDAAAQGIAVPATGGLVLPEQFDGVVFDTSVSLNFTAAKAPESTHLSPTCTRSYDPSDTDIFAIGDPGGTGGQAGDYRIPARARRVMFAIGPEGTIPLTGVGIQFLSDPVNRFQRGEVSNWAGQNERFSPWVDIPQNASLVNVSEIEAPAVTAIWELKL